MPVCVNTHTESSTVQGPGVCCTAFAAAGLAPAVGARVAATDKNGKCFVCEVKRTTTGGLGFKRGKGGTLCPTKVGGCCALLV
jgi:hypothetical protein